MINKDKEQNREIQIYAYYDREAEMYDIPFHSFGDLNSIRKFKIDAEKKGSIIEKFTKEFDLYKLGSFDMHLGKIKLKTELVIEGRKIAAMTEEK